MIVKIEAANQQYHQGNFERARAGYVRARNRGSEESPASYLLHYNTGTAFYKEGDYEAAQNELESALMSPDDSLQEKAHYNLGNVHFKKGMQSQDIKDLEKNGAGAVVLKSLFEEQILREADCRMKMAEQDDMMYARYSETFDYIDVHIKEKELSDYLGLIKDL